MLIDCDGGAVGRERGCCSRHLAGAGAFVKARSSSNWAQSEASAPEAKSNSMAAVVHRSGASATAVCSSEAWLDGVPHVMLPLSLAAFTNVRSPVWIESLVMGVVAAFAAVV